jgi:DNA-binding Xre family transcriptional regulator
VAQFRLHELLEEMPEAKRPSLLRLSQQTGLSYTTVHGIHSNRARRVDLDTLEALAGALGCAPGDLIRKGKRR